MPSCAKILAGAAQRLLLTPVAASGHVPLGMATPYASMLLEQREGEAAVIPTDLFKAGLQAHRRAAPAILCGQSRRAT